MLQSVIKDIITLYMDIGMPATFPDTDFRAFGVVASIFFPALMSDEALYDPLEKRRQFDWSWQAVRYRYRSCAECNEEFKELLAEPSEMWKAGWEDEELTYKLERCIYVFFMSALSVFDSFAFCLYFVGHALQPSAFPKIATPRDITRGATAKAFTAAFPQASVTGLLAGLSNSAAFKTIDLVRNLVGHRLSGRRSVKSASTRHADGTYTTDLHEETWHIPGAAGELMFDEELLQRHLDDITGLLSSLASAARQFAEDYQSVKAMP
jgi:hypothetical protein